MPELPEVETTRRGIEPYINQQKIIKVNVYNDRLRFKPNIELINLKNEKIIAVKRRAKYLLIELNDSYLMFHLGMSGNLKVVDPKLDRLKHDHVEIILDNNLCIRYNDARRFGGCCVISKDLTNNVYFKNLAPEPLSDEFNAQYLQLVFSKRKIPIKSALMKNELVVGVGNIYANEILYKLGIHPLTLASDLDSGLTTTEIKKLWENLVAEIKNTLTLAIEQGGTTLKDFSQPDGQPGYFTQKLQVYGKTGEPCPETGTIIESVIIAGRNSFFSPGKQKIKIK